MGFTTTKHGDTVVVGVEGQLVAANRLDLKRTVLDELERGERRFRLDFGDATYLDSSGLGVLVSLSKKISEQGGELRLGRMGNDLRQLFTLTKLDAMFRFDGGAGGDGTAGAGVPTPVRPAPRAGGELTDR